MVFYHGQGGQTQFYPSEAVGKEDGQSIVEIKAKMKVQVSGGINWSWFKVQNGDLVAVFRLHYGEDQIVAFRKLQKTMVKVDNIDVPMATWREKCDLIANHTSKTDGYSLPEVAEAFGWLDEMFRKTACSFELSSCLQGTMRHLEYHGVAICRIRGGECR